MVSGYLAIITYYLDDYKSRGEEWAVPQFKAFKNYKKARQYIANEICLFIEEYMEECKYEYGYGNEYGEDGSKLLPYLERTYISKSDKRRKVSNKYRYNLKFMKEMVSVINNGHYVENLISWDIKYITIPDEDEELFNENEEDSEADTEAETTEERKTDESDEEGETDKD